MSRLISLFSYEQIFSWSPTFSWFGTTTLPTFTTNASSYGRGLVSGKILEIWGELRVHSFVPNITDSARSLRVRGWESVRPDLTYRTNQIGVGVGTFKGASLIGIGCRTFVGSGIGVYPQLPGDPTSVARAYGTRDVNYLDVRTGTDLWSFDFRAWFELV